MVKTILLIAAVWALCIGAAFVLDLFGLHSPVLVVLTFVGTALAVVALVRRHRVTSKQF